MISLLKRVQSFLKATVYLVAYPVWAKDYKARLSNSSYGLLSHGNCVFVGPAHYIDACSEALQNLDFADKVLCENLKKLNIKVLYANGDQPMDHRCQYFSLSEDEILNQSTLFTSIANIYFAAKFPHKNWYEFFNDDECQSLEKYAHWVLELSEKYRGADITNQDRERIGIQKGRWFNSENRVDLESSISTKN